MSSMWQSVIAPVMASVTMMPAVVTARAKEKSERDERSIEKRGW